MQGVAASSLKVPPRCAILLAPQAPVWCGCSQGVGLWQATRGIMAWKAPPSLPHNPSAHVYAFLHCWPPSSGLCLLAAQGTVYSGLWPVCQGFPLVAALGTRCLYPLAGA